MDDFTVKKKLYILYIFFVLLPLIITDSVVFLIIRNSEMEKQKHDMTNIANAVSYNISSVVNNAGEMAKTIYTSRYIDDFLSRKYDTSAQYIMEYQEFFKDTLLENLLGMNQIVFTMYTNNDTIVKGGKVGNIEDLKETQAYQKLNQSGETKGFFFVYDKNRSGTAEERKVVFLQKLDFFSGPTKSDDNLKSKPVISHNAFTHFSAYPGSAQMPVPIAVAPIFTVRKSAAASFK